MKWSVAFLAMMIAAAPAVAIAQQMSSAAAGDAAAAGGARRLPLVRRRPTAAFSRLRKRGTSAPVATIGRNRSLAGDERIALDAIARVAQVMRSGAAGPHDLSGRGELSAAQLRVLRRLDEAEVATVKRLAELTRTRASSVSEVVSRLAALGFVQRRKSAGDGRIVELTLTESGRALLASADGGQHDALAAGFRRLRPAERRQMARLLEKLAIHVGRESSAAARHREAGRTA